MLISRLKLEVGLAINRNFINCYNVWQTTTDDIHGRSQNLRHLYSSMGLKLEALGFSRNQNKRYSSGAYVTCTYRGPSVKINMYKTLHGPRRSGQICFACVVGKNPKRPPIWAPCKGWQHHYTGRYWRSWISRVYLCKQHCFFIQTVTVRVTNAAEIRSQKLERICVNDCFNNSFDIQKGWFLVCI